LGNDTEIKSDTVPLWQQRTSVRGQSRRSYFRGQSPSVHLFLQSAEEPFRDEGASELQVKIK